MRGCLYRELNSLLCALSSGHSLYEFAGVNLKARVKCGHAQQQDNHISPLERDDLYEIA